MLTTILVFSENKDDLVKMLEELITAFAKVGLGHQCGKMCLVIFLSGKTGDSKRWGFQLEVGQIPDLRRCSHQFQW